jgi:hypothetical protein
MSCHRFNGMHRWGTARDIKNFFAAVDRAAHLQYKRVQEEARRRIERQRNVQLRLPI